MADVNDIVTHWSKPSYLVGEEMVLTFTGGVTRTSDVTLTGLKATFELPDGSTIEKDVAPVIIVDGVEVELSVEIVGLTDPNSPARQWVPAPDGRSISAVA